MVREEEGEIIGAEGLCVYVRYGQEKIVMTTPVQLWDISSEEQIVAERCGLYFILNNN